MSITNRPPPPIAMQSRFGFIPRPTAPGTQTPAGATSRSRSISPTSTISAHSSSSSSLTSQRLMKTQSSSKTTPNRAVPSPSTHNQPANTKTGLSPRPRDLSASKANGKSNLHTSTAASRMRSRTPSRTSATSPSSVASPVSASPAPTSTTSTKPDLNAVRDRYKTQKRMNFFARRTPIVTANGSPMMADALKSPESVTTLQNQHHPSPLTRTQVKTTTTTKGATWNDCLCSRRMIRNRSLLLKSCHRMTRHPPVIFHLHIFLRALDIDNERWVCYRRHQPYLISSIKMPCWRTTTAVWNPMT